MKQVEYSILLAARGIILENVSGILGGVPFPMPWNQSEDPDSRWCAVTLCPHSAERLRLLCVVERALPSMSWRLGEPGAASQEVKMERVVAAQAAHRGTNSWPQAAGAEQK